MKKNMGTFDRIMRLIVALVIGFLYYNGTINGFIGNIAVVLSGVFVLTSLISFCPLYLPFKINTQEKK
ncbi:MAG: DUF2892 domain-containing protein [Flavobacterium sp.]|nr:DUF2892 domain-containing protein [Flavobacterium sp.]